MSQEIPQGWADFGSEERLTHFRSTSRPESEDLFTNLTSQEQLEILLQLPEIECRSWMRVLEPDDAADLIQEAPHAKKEQLLQLLDEVKRKEVVALMAYAEDKAGGLMNPRFARVRPEMTIDEAIRYLRKQAPHVETIQYAYGVDSQQRLLGVVSLRELFSSDPNRLVKDVMGTELTTVPEEMDQDEVGRLLTHTNLVALPVVDKDGHLKGIITFDDIADVMNESATEDIQKMGGTEALDSPYLKTQFLNMVQKRVGWLAILFVGEMLTATAMGYFEHEIAKAVVLALFIPLIISSGGNSGSQASTLVIRAMALGEIRLRDWWRILRREVGAGIVMGAILGSLGFLRIVVWHSIGGIYGDHYLWIALTIGLSLVGVVCWGAIAGSMLPFLLRRIGFDPASASTPFVATLVDVTGLLIYFSIASCILSGILL